MEAGQTIGILGGTGSAKSSLVNLISRLYDVSEGSVRVGGHDVREYDLENIKILPVEGGGITSTFSFISKKEHKLSLPEQLFKHLILDCYRNF